MKKVILFCAMMLLVGGVCWAGQKYNAFTGEWEHVPDNWEIKYNAFDGTRSYQPPDAKVEYNPFSGEYEWDSGHNE